jgi:hypothetical protein
MEFEGRIKNVMPERTGTSQNGVWRALPFVFEYKENESDPWYDSVQLETFDTNIINGIESCCQKDDQGNLVVNNNELTLLRDIYVRIGFRHKAKVFVPKDTTKPARFINEIRVNLIQAIRKQQQAPAIGQQQPAPQPQAPTYNPYAPQTAAPFPPQTEEHDDLPF